MQASQSKTRKRPGQGTQAPKGSRKDPRAKRHTEGAAGWANLKNANLKRKYVLVSQHDKEQGVDYYLYLGYTAESQTEGGVCFARGRTGVDGDEMVMRGHLLMSIPLEAAEELEDFGADGETGQAGADEIEERIIQKQGGEDLLRGLMGHRHARTQNMIGSNEVER